MGFAAACSDASLELNECIDEVHALFQKENPGVTVPIENVGIPNSGWHFKVVLTAFKRRDAPFTFCEVPERQWSEVLLDTSSFKCYLVVGWLNSSFVGRTGKSKKEQTISQLFDPAVTIDSDWTHSTAVMHGFVVDNTWVHEEHGIMPAKYLWLLGNNPDRTKGFFRDIRKVFEVDCGQPSARNVIETKILPFITNK